MKTVIRVTSVIFTILLCICGIAIISQGWDEYQMYLNTVEGSEFSVLQLLRRQGIVIIPGIIFIIATILFFLKHKIGWILTSSMIIIAGLFIGAVFGAFTKLNSISEIGLVVLAFAVIGLSVFSLWAKSTRERFNIGRNEIILSLASVVILGTAIFIMIKLK